MKEFTLQSEQLFYPILEGPGAKKKKIPRMMRIETQKWCLSLKNLKYFVCLDEAVNNFNMA